MFVLKPKEIREITGTPNKEEQIRNLRENGIPFTIDINGRPKVPYSLYENALLGGKTKKKIKEPEYSNLDS